MEVIVVSDGKKGHVNQSLALAELLGAQRIQVLAVKRRVPVLDFCARLFSCVLSPRNYPKSWLKAVLRRCLDVSPSQKLSVPGNTPIVIATGTLTAVYSLALAGEMGARAVHILSPSFVPFRLFDAVVLPKHDVKRKPKRNMVALPVALGTVGGKSLVESLTELKRRLGVESALPGDYIAVLIGGDSAHYVMEEAAIVEAVGKLAAMAKQSSARVLLTTSRRTSAAIEGRLQAIADAMPDSFTLCVWGRTDKYNPIPAFLDLAKVVAVTEESASMVSEAILAGHKPLIISIARRGRSRKFLRFYSFLEGQGLVWKLPPGGRWEEVWSNAISVPRRSQLEVAASIGLPQAVSELRKLLKLEQTA